MKGLFHPVTIGELTIPGNLFLAPLAGFTDRAFRSVCSAYGASLTFSEMVSAEGLARSSEKTRELLQRAGNEHCFAVQLFMSTPEQALRALPHVIAVNPDIIDINCGCPVPKVVKTGAGSALMKHPETIHAIVNGISASCDIPVTVKIRLGWDNSSRNYLEVADAAVSGGASLLTMHARTRAQGYSGTADISHLAVLKQAVSVPVIGSGDLFSAASAREMLEQTGIDGVMFARGAIGNPFIFTATRHLLEHGNELPSPGPEERIAQLLAHLDAVILAKGETVACREMRKHAGAYMKGLPGASRIRREIVTAATREEYRAILETYTCQS